MNEMALPVTQDGHYQVTATDAGVYLSVWPPLNGGLPVKKAAIIQDLNSRNFGAIEFDALSMVVNEASGQPVLIVNSLPSQDGRYQITATDAGVYLSVWPPVNAGSPVKKAEVTRDLSNRNFTNFESNFLSIVIKEAICQPVLIINSLLSQDGRYHITGTDTGVYLSVWPPVNTGSPVRKSEIIQGLTDRNFANFDSDFISVVIKEASGQPTLIINSLPSEDGRYQITATDAGIYLSVWSPINAGLPVKKAEIIQDLTNQNFSSFDSDFISVIIKEALGQPILVVNSLPVLQVEANIHVRVRPDHLGARIDILAPEGAPQVTMTQVLDKLKAVGVIFGIDEPALEGLVQTGSGTGIVCACGIAPTNGNDAFLKYHVDGDSQGRPVQMEDGRVDYKDTNYFLCVEEGQLLVEKIPATLGISGIDVFGLPIPAKPGKDIPMPIGKNVIVVDNWRLYAAINGHLHIFLDKRINVVPVIEIDGDVDYSTGNIDFKGSVIIRGSVQPGFSVKAGGNVEICGSVCGGTVEGNNVIVRTGIQGMSRSVIKARERMATNFIENAFVYADQEVIVRDVILNSSVFAGIRVIVEGGRGLVRGGRLSAGEEIRAITIGNQAHVTTELEVSVNPFIKDELLKLRLERKKMEAPCEEMKRSLAYIQNQGITNLTAEKRDRYEKTVAEYNGCLERMEEIQQRIINIETFLYSLKPGKIRVCGVIYPCSKVCIGALTKIFNDRHQYICLYVQDTEITFSSLR